MFNSNKKIKNLKHKRLFGFTIVELIVVIAVIGILGSIAIVSYNGWRSTTIANQLKSDLNGIATAMEDARNFGNGYPATFPNTFKTSSGVILSGGSADGKTYCIEAGSSQDSTLHYYITQDLAKQGARLGTCASHPQVLKQLASGYYHTCAISTDDNKAYCWGQNIYGQLGNNSIYNSPTPVPVDMTGVLAGKTIKSIAAGYYHTCAIASDDQAYCWGYNNYSQLGNNSTTTSRVPVAVTNTGVLAGKTVKSITVGRYHSCVLASDNQAYCWGYGTSGQLGNNTILTSKVPVAVDTTGVLAGKTVVQVEAGYLSTCVIASDNQAYCWGDNTYGQVGNNTVVGSSVPVAVDISGVLAGKTIKSISAGFYSTCVIASDNKVYCWGYNAYGQLGNNTTVDSLVPVAVVTTGVLSGKTVKILSVGGYHSCVITTDNKIYCWGYNTYGELGDGTVNNSSVPMSPDISGILAGKTITLLSSGYYQTCTITSDNLTECWGSNLFGQLGTGLSAYNSMPLAVVNTGVLAGKTISSISSSGVYHTCAIASDNQAYCWGYNVYGQLGNNTTIDAPLPSAVTNTGVLAGKTVKSLTTGNYHTCAIASDDQAYCWGYNTYSQLGNNSTTNSSVPIAVTNTGALAGKTVKSISAGYYHTCVLASDNLVYCWGYNAYGQLGNNSTTTSKVPVAVTMTGVLAGKTIKSISVGYYHTCAIASDNLAYCWGYNPYGGLGNNTIVNSSVPVAVDMTGVLLGKTIKSISASNLYHTCAIASDDLPYCWGYNNNGQLGNNTVVDSPVPVAVINTGVLAGKTVKSIATGYYHSCVIASDNQSYCWGDNVYGQLGDNSVTDRLVPVAVNTTGRLNGLTNLSITVGRYQTCVVASDNQAYCWGYDNYGQLGNNYLTVQSYVPAYVLSAFPQ